MIREASELDIPEILRMGKLFAKEAGLSSDDETIKQTANNLLESPLANIFIGDGAMAGAVAYPMFMDASQICVQEMFWWVDEGKRSTGIGGELMDSIEGWAKSIGANRVTMIGLTSSPAHIDAYYRKRGYEPLEVNYWKEI